MFLSASLWVQNLDLQSCTVSQIQMIHLKKPRGSNREFFGASGLLRADPQIIDTLRALDYSSVIIG